MKKKKIVGLTAALCAIAAIAAFNMNVSSHVKGLSDVSIENIEVLAQEVGTNWKYWQHPCGKPFQGGFCNTRESELGCTSATDC